MNYFQKIIFRIGNWGTALGAFFMCLVALIVVATVIGRAFHIALPGTFDLVETMIVVSIAFAIVYGMIEDRHLRAEIAVHRTKGRIKSAIEIFHGIFSIAYWGVLFWAAYLVLVEKIKYGENTELLDVPIVPFRMVWVICLILMVLMLVIKQIHHIIVFIKGGEEK